MRIRNPMCGCVCAGISADAITIYIDKQSDPLYFMCPVMPMKRRKMQLTLFNESFVGVSVVYNKKAVTLHRLPSEEGAKLCLTFNLLYYGKTKKKRTKRTGEHTKRKRTKLRYIVSN